MVGVLGDNEIVDLETGEVIVERKRIRLVRAFSRGVEDCVARGAPYLSFRLSANKHGQILSAIGRIVISSVDLSYPGCGTADEITSADLALDHAGLTRGTSPAGRAMDWSMRTKPDLAQWRPTRQKLTAFTGAMYGGIQFGGDKKPRPKAGRICIDVVSSYPAIATGNLPRLREAAFERGLRRNAAFVWIDGKQFAPALFSRLPNGNTTYSEHLSGWYVADELDYHVACGRVVVKKVRESVTFPHSENYLAFAIDHLFGHRERYPRGTPERGVLKSALNGLLGKFASPISTWRVPTQLELEAAAHSRKFSVIRLGRSALINDLTLANIYPRHCNVAWTALVYGRARVRLWQMIDEIERAGGSMLWCHTDCIIADVPPEYVIPNGQALGEWRLIEH